MGQESATAVEHTHTHRREGRRRAGEEKKGEDSTFVRKRLTAHAVHTMVEEMQRCEREEG